jgi:hypothetical protein
MGGSGLCLRGGAENGSAFTRFPLRFCSLHLQRLVQFSKKGVCSRSFRQPSFSGEEIRVVGWRADYESHTESLEVV